MEGLTGDDSLGFGKNLSMSGPRTYSRAALNVTKT